MGEGLDRLTGALARRRTMAFVLLLLIAAAYGASLRNELVFDERIFMQRDERVHRLDLGRIFGEALWSAGAGDDSHVHQYYRPLQLLPLALSHAAFGDAAWPSHLLSLALHLANCLLVLGLLRALLPRAEVAGGLALLFAVHPGYSEAVLWASDVAGLGAALCTLAIVRWHVLASPPDDGGHTGRDFIVLPVLLLCGLWFKESGILAVALIAAYDLVGAPDRGLGRLWGLRWRYAVLVPPLAAYAVLRLHALGGALPGIEAVPLTRAELALNAVALLADFAATFLWPFDLNMYHDFDAVRGVGETRFAIGALLGLVWALAFALSLRRRRVAAFGVLWAAIAVAPHLLVRWPQLNVFAERYLYLPAVGILLAAGDVWCALPLPATARRAVAASAAALVALFTAVDLRRAADWRDELTLYGKTLTQSARAELIRTNLAVRLLERQRYDDGIALLEALQRSDPTWPDTRHNLGLLYLGKGDRTRALQAFEQAARRDPFRPETLLNLGYLYDQAGRREEAVRAYLRLVRRAPRFTDAWYNLGAIAFETGQLANARLAAERVLALRPDDTAARALLARAGSAAPPTRSPDGTPAQETIDRCRAAKQVIDAGRGDEAIAMLESAAWLDERAALPHHYLANLFYLQGRLEAAVGEQREALRRAPQSELYRRNLRALEAAVGQIGSVP